MRFNVTLGAALLANSDGWRLQVNKRIPATSTIKRERWLMSEEFERFKALLDLSEPTDWEPQVDPGEAAKLAGRWSWLIRRAQEQRAQLQKRGPDQSANFGPDTSTEPS